MLVLAASCYLDPSGYRKGRKQRAEGRGQRTVSSAWPNNRSRLCGFVGPFTESTSGRLAATASSSAQLIAFLAAIVARGRENLEATGRPATTTWTNLATRPQTRGGPRSAVTAGRPQEPPCPAIPRQLPARRLLQASRKNCPDQTEGGTDAVSLSSPAPAPHTDLAQPRHSPTATRRVLVKQAPAPQACAPAARAACTH